MFMLTGADSEFGGLEETMVKILCVIILIL